MPERLAGKAHGTRHHRDVFHRHLRRTISRAHLPLLLLIPFPCAPHGTGFTVFSGVSIRTVFAAWATPGGCIFQHS